MRFVNKSHSWELIRLARWPVIAERKSTTTLCSFHQYIAHSERIVTTLYRYNYCQTMIQTLFSSNDSHSTSLTDSLVEDWLTLLHAQPTKQTSKGKTWKFSKSHNMRWSQHFCQIFIRTHSIFRMRSWSPNNKGILSQFLVLVFPRPLEMEIKYRLFKQWQIKSYSLSKAWMWREKNGKVKICTTFDCNLMK